MKALTAWSSQQTDIENIMLLLRKGELEQAERRAASFLDGQPG